MRYLELLFLLSKLMLETTDFVFISQPEKLNFIFYVFTQASIQFYLFIISFALFLTIKSWIKKTQYPTNIEIIEYFGIPLILISTVEILKYQNSLYRKIICLAALILIEFIIIIKTINYQFYYPKNYLCKYTKINYFPSILLLIKINMLVFTPIFFSSFSLLTTIICSIISLIKAYINLKYVERLNPTYEYITMLITIGSFFTLFDYILQNTTQLQLHLSTPIIILIVIFTYKKPQFLIKILEYKYLNLITIGNLNEQSQLLQFMLILNKNHQIDGITWSKQFQFKIKSNFSFRKDHSFKKKNPQIEISNIQKNNEFENSSYIYDIINEFIALIKSQKTKYSKLGLYLVSKINSADPKIFQQLLYIYYKCINTQVNQNSIIKWRSILCHNLINKKSQQNIHDKYIKKYLQEENLYDELLKSFQLFVKTDQVLIDHLCLKQRSYSKISQIFTLKNQLRNEIQLKIIAYSQYKLSKIYYLLQYFKQIILNNKIGSIKNIIQSYQESYYSKLLNLSKNNIFNPKNMIVACSGVKKVGQIILSNSLFKQNMEIEKTNNNIFEDNYNINEFLPTILRQNHQNSMQTYDFNQNNSYHDKKQCFLVSLKSGKLIKVNISIKLLFYRQQDLILFIQMKYQWSSQYQIINNFGKTLSKSKQFDKINNIEKQEKSKQIQFYGKNYTLNIKKQKQDTQKQQQDVKEIKQNIQKIDESISILLQKQKYFEKQTHQKIQCKQNSKNLKIFLLFIQLLLIITTLSVFYIMDLKNTQNIQNYSYDIDIQGDFFYLQFYNPMDTFVYYLNKIKPQNKTIIQIIKTSMDDVWNRYVQIHSYVNIISTNEHVRNMLMTKFSSQTAMFDDIISAINNVTECRQIVCNIYFQIVYDKSISIQFLLGHYKSNLQYLQLLSNSSQKLKYYLSNINQNKNSFKLLIKFIYVPLYLVLVVSFISIIYCYASKYNKAASILDLCFKINLITFKNTLSMKLKSLEYLTSIKQKYVERVIQQVQNQAMNINKLNYQLNQLTTIEQKPKKNQLYKSSLIIIILVMLGVILFFSYQQYLLNINIQLIYQKQQEINYFLTDSSKFLTLTNMILQQLVITETNQFKQYFFNSQLNHLIRTSFQQYFLKLFSKTDIDKIMYQDICAGQFKWKCYNFMLNNGDLKTLISDSILKIRKIGKYFFNNNFKQTNKQIPIQAINQLYEQISTIRILTNQIVQKSANQQILALNQQSQIINIFNYVFLGILGILLIWFSFYIQNRYSIYQQEAFKLAPFKELYQYQDYRFYINYFYSQRYTFLK